MPQLKLSKVVVDGLSAEQVDIVFWDIALPGFGVRVKQSGVKSYIVQYRVKNDRGMLARFILPRLANHKVSEVGH